MKSGNKVFQARYVGNEPVQRALPSADEWLGFCVEALDGATNPQDGQPMWRLQPRDARDVLVGDGEYGRAIRAVAAYTFDYDPSMVLRGYPGESATKAWIGTPYVLLNATCRRRHDAAIDADVLDVWLNFYDHHDFTLSRGNRIVEATVTAIETTVATAMGPELYRAGCSGFELVSQTSERRPTGWAFVDRLGDWLDNRQGKPLPQDKAREHDKTVWEDGVKPPTPLIPAHVRAKMSDVTDKVEKELGDSPAGRALRYVRKKTAERFPSESVSNGNRGAAVGKSLRSPEELFNYALHLDTLNRDLAGAAELHQQVIDSKDPEWAPVSARALGDIRRRLDDFGGAAAAYQLAIDSRHPEEAPEAALSLGRLRLHELNDVEGAVVAFQMAINSGHLTVAPAAMNYLGSLREHHQHDIEGAIATYRMAIDTGHYAQVPSASAANSLGRLLENETDGAAGAAEAYQIAIDSGDHYHAPWAAIRLGLLRETRLNDLEGADDSYLIAIESGNTVLGAEAANRLGDLRQNKLNDYEGARASYEWAVKSSDQNWAPCAAFHLGVLNETHLGDIAKAADSYRMAINSRHPNWAPRAAENLDKMESATTAQKGREDDRGRGPVDDVAAPDDLTSTGQPEVHRPDLKPAPGAAVEKAPKGQQRAGSRDRGAIDVSGGKGHLASSRLSAEDEVMIDQILRSWRDCTDWAKRCAGPLFPAGDERESVTNRARSVDYVLAKAACEASLSGRWELLDPRERARRISTVTAARRTRNILEHEPSSARVSRLSRAAAVLTEQCQLLDSLSPGELVVTEEELTTYLAGFAGPSGTS